MESILFMIDMDNTLLDNDGVRDDMAAALVDALGPAPAARLWELYEAVRAETGVVDFIETTRRLRDEHRDDEPAMDAATALLMRWDFRPRMFPRAIETVEYLNTIGLPVIISDGDPVFQPGKIQRCGASEAVEGRVFVFAHKEDHLAALLTYFNPRHTVLIDDKPAILMRSKAALGGRLTTVHVLQGKYALDPQHAVDYRPDIVVKNVSDLLRYGQGDFLLPAQRATSA